jgi:hypothetical protein
VSTKPSRRVTRGKVKCVACGAKFVPVRRDSRYCSGACRQRAHRARATVDDIDRRIHEAKVLYWSLIREKAEATGKDVGPDPQFVDVNGNVFIRGKLVGQKAPFRPGWAAWGLEAAGPPFSPPPPAGVDVA